MKLLFNTDWIAFAIVFAAFGFMSKKYFAKYLAAPMAQFLLSRGQVKWAMRFKKIAKAGCSDC